MYYSHAVRLFILWFAGGAAVVCFFASLGQAGSRDKTSSARSVYHADPQHLWNRLHEALFIRIGPDGRTYGQDRLEPLLWSHSKHLLDGSAHERVIAVLEEFLKSDGEKLIQDRLKRAVLQRDLWLVFNWLEDDHSSFALPLLTPEAVRTAVTRLRRPLAAVIGRLALSPEDIRSLSANYEAAVASGQFASRFDPEQPEVPYLPPELFAADGPWVCVGRSDGITAPRHLAEATANRFTNSVFIVFLRLPTGRGATLEYLNQLRSFGQPLLISNPVVSDQQSRPFMPNPQLPQFPKWTELALVRRALLIDSSYRVAAAPITESVQLRIVRGDVPSATPEILQDATGSSSAGIRRVRSWQSVHELRLSRSALFENRAGGLRVAGADERDFKTGFNAHAYDVFERSPPGDESFSAWGPQPGIRQTCFGCHTLPGVYSFNSLQDFQAGLSDRDGNKVRPFPLSAMTVSEVAAAAVQWKEQRATWISLRALLAE